MANDGPNEFICSYGAQNISVIQATTENYWSPNVPAGAGTLGLGL